MKANSKRKVFGDAVDLLMGDIEEVTMPRGVEMVPVKSIQPFHECFRLLTMTRRKQTGQLLLLRIFATRKANGPEHHSGCCRGRSN